MKKFMILSTFVALLICLFSCGGNGLDDGEALQVSYDAYDAVGEAHNVVLADLYDHLSDLKQAGALPVDFESCRSQVQRFIHGKQTMGYTLSVSGPDKDLLFPELLNGQWFRKATSNEEIIEVFADSLDIVRQHREHFDSLCVILERNSGEARRQALEDYYAYIDESVADTEEKTSLLHGLGTMINSAEYWDEHYHEWEMLFSEGLAKPCMGIVGAIGIIDGVGAVIGTLEGFRDTEPGEDGRAWTIAGRAVGEAAKTSTYAVLALVLL
jgi:hypothetical protein